MSFSTTLSSHDVPPFSIAKGYHKEIKPDVGVLQMEVQCRYDRIPSTTPGAEPPRDARESGSARSHSTHLETSSSDRP